MKAKLIFIAVSAALSCSAANATGNGNVQQQLDDLKAGLHQVHMNTNQKYSESWGLEDRANIAKLQDQKLDKSVFTADQQRQDKAITAADTKAGAAYQIAQTAGGMAAGVQQNLNAAVAKQQERDAGQDDHINAVQGAAQVANDRAGALEVRADRAEADIRDTNMQVALTDKRSQNNAVRLDGVEKVNTQQDKAIASNTQRIITSEGDIKQLYANGDYAQSRIDAANANIEANRAAQVASNKRIAANTKQLTNHEQRLGQLESQTNARFADVDRRIDDVRDRADAGVASVAAMASIPQVTEYQSFAVGAGVGSRHNQQALAVGFSARAASNVVIKASVSTDTTDSFTFGAGASIGW